MKKIFIIFVATSIMAACGNKNISEPKSNSLKNGTKKIVLKQFLETDQMGTSDSNEDRNKTNLNDEVVSFDDLSWSSTSPYDGLNTSANEIAFLTGYITSQYLSLNKNQYDNEETQGLKIGTYGGMDTPVVTKFMAGFQQGVKYWNQNRSEEQNQVEFVSLGSNIEAYLSGSFDLGDGNALTQQLIDAKVDIILPVSGIQVKNTLSLVESSNLNIKVIGLDTHQNIWMPETIKDSLKRLWLKAKDDINILNASKNVTDNFEV